MQSRHFGLAGKKTTTPSSSACRMLQLRLWGMTLRFIGVVAELHLKLLLVVLFFSCWYGGQRCCWWEWGCRDVSGGGRDASPFYCFSLHCSLHSAAVCSITSDRSRRFRKKAIFSFPMPENNPDITAPLHITVCYVQLYVFGCWNIKIQYSLVVAVLLSAAIEYVSGWSHWSSDESIHLSFIFSYNCTKPRPILTPLWAERWREICLTHHHKSKSNQDPSLW